MTYLDASLTFVASAHKAHVIPERWIFDEVMPYIIGVPVLAPAIAAAISFIFGKRIYIQRALAVIALVLSTLSASYMMLVTDRHGAFAINIGDWGSRDNGHGPLGITLVVDGLSAIMIVVSNIALTAVLFYAVGQGVKDSQEGEPTSIFQPSYLLLSAGVSNAFLAGDLFNLYVSFEVLLMASFVLLTLGGSKSRIKAAYTYVVVSMVSSIIFVLGITYIYAATGTVNLAELAICLPNIAPGTRSVLYAVILVGFGIKAAVFPLSSWLPDSYPTAPAPVTAVFAGLLTKVGAYSIIRTHTLLFPDKTLDHVLEVAGLLTMLVGILGAIAQDDIKRLLSFTLVSHMGYMFFGISLATEQSLSAAIFYTVHHILVQTTLFLVVGLIERQAGSSSLRRLGGLGTAFPALALVLFIPALNLGGIPPFSGFIGKVALIQAGVSVGGSYAWLLIAGSLVTSLLTLYVVVRVWTLAVWRPREDAPEGNLSNKSASFLLEDTREMEFTHRQVSRMPFRMVFPTATLTIIGVLLALFAKPVLTITNNSAHELLERTPYITAVLGGRQ